MTDENQAILYADYKRSPWWDRLFQRVMWFWMSLFEDEPLSKPWVKP